MICNDGICLFEATSRLAQRLRRCLLLTFLLYARQSIRASNRRQLRIIKDRRNNKKMFEGVSRTEGCHFILRNPGCPRDLEVVEPGTQEACWLSLSRLLIKPGSDACSSRSRSKRGEPESFARYLVKQDMWGHMRSTKVMTLAGMVSTMPIGEHNAAPEASGMTGRILWICGFRCMG